ncbi:MAG: DUF167 domain-containing protein [Comamonadaceae bacterium]|nr:DUF167 domain-containing protein [Comamonadaceae bacterium]
MRLAAPPVDGKANDASRRLAGRRTGTAATRGAADARRSARGASSWNSTRRRRPSRPGWRGCSWTDGGAAPAGVEPCRKRAPAASAAATPPPRRSREASPGPQSDPGTPRRCRALAAAALDARLRGHDA